MLGLQPHSSPSAWTHLPPADSVPSCSLLQPAATHPLFLPLFRATGSSGSRKAFLAAQLRMVEIEVRSSLHSHSAILIVGLTWHWPMHHFECWILSCCKMRATHGSAISWESAAKITKREWVHMKVICNDNGQKVTGFFHGMLQKTWMNLLARPVQSDMHM